MNPQIPPTPDPAELELMRKWVETWKFAGPELERIKKEELRELTEEEGTRRALLVLDADLDGAWIAPSRVTSSGLIEQQRIFARQARPSA